MNPEIHINDDLSDILAKKILYTLERERFSEWYKTRFESYICGDEPKIEKEQILVEIKQMFRV